jgi:hypothetical protein
LIYLLIVDALTAVVVVVAIAFASVVLAVAVVTDHLDYYYLTDLFADNCYLYLCLDLKFIKKVDE